MLEKNWLPDGVELSIIVEVPHSLYFRLFYYVAGFYFLEGVELCPLKSWVSSRSVQILEDA